MSYSYKQWTQDQTADNVIHASDLERWQDGIADAGGTWSGSWTDEKDTLTAEQLNALEQEIETLTDGKWTAKTWEDGNIPGTEEWNRIEDGLQIAVYGGRLIDSGDDTSTITWELYENGLLILRGTGTTSAGDGATSLYATLNITKCIIMDGITYLNTGVFWNCSMTEIELPDSLTRLGTSALRSSNLINIIIPENVATINGNVFAACSNLNAVVFAGNAPTFSANSVFSGTTCTVYYPSDKDGWDELDTSSFQGNLTWIPYNSADGIPDIEVTTSPQSVEESDEVAAPEAEEIE